MSNFNIELCKQSTLSIKQKSETLKASEFFILYDVSTSYIITLTFDIIYRAIYLLA